jgi:hypothetical protein
LGRVVTISATASSFQWHIKEGTIPGTVQIHPTGDDEQGSGRLRMQALAESADRVRLCPGHPDCVVTQIGRGYDDWYIMKAQTYETTEFCQTVNQICQAHVDIVSAVDDYPRDPMLGYWPLDGSGMDMSGNGLDGTVSEHGAVSWAPGIHRLSYDATSDGAIIIASHDLVENAANVLMMAYIRALLPPTGALGRKIIMSKHESFASGVQAEAGILVLQGLFHPGCHEWWGRDASLIPPSTWTHVGVGVDGSNHKHFINGVFVEQDSCAGQLSSQPARLAVGGPAGPFGGSIDEVMLFSVMLSSAKITAVYHTTYAHPSAEHFVSPTDVLPGLIGYWPLDGDCADRSAGGYNMNSACATEEMAAHWVTGRRGLAIHFNSTPLHKHLGTNQQLFTPMASGLVREQVMMLAWIMHSELIGSDDRGVKHIMEKQGSFALGLSCGSICTGALQGRFAPCSGWRWWGHYGIPVQEWTHVAVGVDGTNEKHFINADLTEENRCAGHINDGPTASDLFVIGAGQRQYDEDTPHWDYDTGTYSNFYGMRVRPHGLAVDEAMLFNTFLDAPSLHAAMHFNGHSNPIEHVSSIAAASMDSWYRRNWYRGSTSCVECCVECQPGMYDEETRANTPCENCALGWYSESSASSTCATAIFCPEGFTFTPRNNETDTDGMQLLDFCVECPPGRADLDKDGATPCELCEAGRYSNASAATECVKCPPSSYAVPGSLLLSSCISCAAVAAYGDAKWVRTCVHTVGYTSFEEPMTTGTTTIPLYYDTFGGESDHKVKNNAGQNPVAYTACTHGGIGRPELGFQTFYTNTNMQLSMRGLADGHLIGVIGDISTPMDGDNGKGGVAPHGSQYYVMMEAGGFIHVEIDRVALQDYSNVQMKCWVHIEATSWEDDDIIKVWAELVAANGTRTLMTVLAHTRGDDGLNEWKEHTKHPGNMVTAAVMAFGLQTDSRSEEVWFDHFQLLGTGLDRSDLYCSRGECPNGTQRSYVAGAQAQPEICEVCPAGRFDTDGNPGTPCAYCPAGRFSSISGEGTCSGVCRPGTTYMRHTTNVTSCEPCSKGTYDADKNSTTPCQHCPMGQFSAGYGAVQCTPACDPGWYDRNKAVGSTIASTTCVTCAIGRADIDGDAATACTRCNASQFSNITGATECTRCPAGTSTMASDDGVEPDTHCGLSVQRGGLRFEVFDLHKFSRTKLFAEGAASYINNFPLGGKGCLQTCDGEYSDIQFRRDMPSRGCGLPLVDMDLAMPLVRVPELRELVYNASIFADKIPQFESRTGYFMRWHGAIEVPVDGLYSFRTVSDDGSMLHIDGNVVVDNDGVRCCYQKQGDLSHSNSNTYAKCELDEFTGAGNPNFCLPCNGEDTLSSGGTEYTMNYQPHRAMALTKAGSVYLSAGMHTILVTYFTLEDSNTVNGEDEEVPLYLGRWKFRESIFPTTSATQSPSLPSSLPPSSPGALACGVAFVAGDYQKCADTRTSCSCLGSACDGLRGDNTCGEIALSYQGSDMVGDAGPAACLALCESQAQAGCCQYENGSE